MDETVLSAKSAFKTIDTAMGEGTSASSQPYAHDSTFNFGSNDGSNEVVNVNLMFLMNLFFMNLFLFIFCKDWEKRSKEETAGNR